MLHCLSSFSVCTAREMTDSLPDYLQRTIVAEELIVKKAGGKYKMLPLFTETSTKIKAVNTLPYLSNILHSN